MKLTKIEKLKRMINELSMSETTSGDYKFKEGEVYWKDGWAGDYNILRIDEMKDDELRIEFEAIKEIYEDTFL